jgi:type I restriction enzyme, R subunit
MRQGFTESVIEEAALAWLERLSWTVKHGPEIAPGELAAEHNATGRSSWCSDCRMPWHG